MYNYCRDLAEEVLQKSVVTKHAIEDTEDIGWISYIQVTGAIAEMKKLLRSTLRGYKAVLSRWLLTQKIFDYLEGVESLNDAHPVLPFSSRLNTGFIEYVKRQIQNGQAALALHQGLVEISRQFIGLQVEEAKTTSGGTYHFHRKTIKNEVEITFSHNITFRISLQRYQKLKEEYMDNYGSKKGLLASITRIWLRYYPLTSICPGYYGGIPMNLLSYLREDFNLKTELFASPLNNVLPHYLSPYPSIDYDFGSEGDFFSFLAPENESLDGIEIFEVNPPFTEEWLAIASVKILESFRNYPTLPFLYFYFHPTWKDSYSYRILSESEHLQIAIPFGSGKHYYRSGLSPEEGNICAKAPTTLFILRQNREPLSARQLQKIKQKFSSQ